jgi:hypothetical protein
MNIFRIFRDYNVLEENVIKLSHNLASRKIEILNLKQRILELEDKQCIKEKKLYSRINIKCDKQFDY